MTRYSPKTGLPTTYQAGPFDSTHLYCQWGGKLYGGETWSNGMRFAGPAASASADSAAMLANVGAAIVAFHQRATSHIGAEVKLSFVKLNAVNTEGHYIDQATNQATYADLAGGGGAGGAPTQIALAIGLTTGFSRGPAHKGRIYVPQPALSLTAGGVYAVADAAAIKASFETMRVALNAVNANWKLAVFSRKAGSPAHRLITGCQVGVVPDTQRRRRRSLIENYQ